MAWAMRNLLVEHAVDECGHVGHIQHAIAVEVALGEIGRACAQNHVDESRGIVHVDFTIACDVAFNRLACTIGEADDVAKGSRLVDTINEVGRFGAGIVGFAILHQFAINLDFLGWQGGLCGSIFQRLHEASASPHGARR